MKKLALIAALLLGSTAWAADPPKTESKPPEAPKPYTLTFTEQEATAQLEANDAVCRGVGAQQVCANAIALNATIRKQLGEQVQAREAAKTALAPSPEPKGK